MSKETTPIFIIGSGRCGTRMVFKLLSGIPDIEIHHEYLCTHIQPVSALHYMGLLNEAQVKEELKKLHASAIHYSNSRIWADCSNKLSWIVRPLSEMFPNSKFVHLVRDGRKVASSYFHKLPDEMYDDKSVEALSRWLKERESGSVPMPPPEKKYWWNIPQEGQPFFAEFPKFDQFQRACYQWAQSNRAILDSLKDLPAERKLTVKLEELSTDKETFGKFLDFFGVDYEERLFEFVKVPRNAVFPMDFKLTSTQLSQFSEIASDMMRELGYEGKPEYRVDYGDKPPEM